MHSGAQIAVVIPAYNEQAHIGATLAGIPAFVDRIYVVDDGSRDGTSERARAVSDVRVEVFRHARNCGVGAAIRTGYRAAFAAGADAVAVMAGDDQMDPVDLERLLAPVLDGQCDYAKGDRLSHPEVVWRMPWPRLLGNRVLSRLTGLALGIRIRDSQCGYTVLGRRAFERLHMDGLWPGYGYPNDLLSMLVFAQLRVADVVVRPVYGEEVSGVRLRHALCVIPYLLVRAWWRRSAPDASLVADGDAQPARDNS